MLMKSEEREKCKNRSQLEEKNSHNFFTSEIKSWKLQPPSHGLANENVCCFKMMSLSRINELESILLREKNEALIFPSLKVGNR